jgi:protocatechuate 3,4-dioxygenase beta subunit
MQPRHRRLVFLAIAGAMVATTIALWPRDASIADQSIGARQLASSSAAPVDGDAAKSARAENAERTAVASDAAAAPRIDASPTRLLGRVERPNGEPVPDAEVTLLRRAADTFWAVDPSIDDPAFAHHVDTVARARTDTGGHFAFTVARGVPYRVRATAPGCAPTHKAGCVGGQFVVLTVAPGATIVGTVKNQADGAPVAGARVDVSCGQAAIGTAETARDGSFQFLDMPAGELAVEAFAPGFIESTYGVTTRPGETARVVVWVKRGEVVHGTVRDAISQAPIGGAHVGLTWTANGAVTTDSAGHYELRCVLFEEWSAVQVRAEGYASATRPASDGRDGALDFVLQRGGGVRGRVLDASGKALSAAIVGVYASFAMRPGGSPLDDWLHARVADDGAFAVDGLMPEHTYVLCARADGCGARTWPLPGALLPGEWLDVGDLQLHTGAIVEGAVVDENGKPFAHLFVYLRGENADHRRLAGNSAATPDARDLATRASETDAEGRFHFAGVAAGKHELSVSAPNLGREQRQPPFELADGQVLDNVRLVFVGGLSIAGRLHLPAGIPAGEWAVYAHGNNALTIAIAATDGSFTFEHLLPGMYSIHLTQAPEGWIMAPVNDVAAGRTDVELTPIAAAFIAGRVVDAGGVPIRADVYGASGETRLTKPYATDEAGRFRMPVLPGARVDVHASAREKPLSDTVVKDVLAGTDVEVKLTGPGK